MKDDTEKVIHVLLKRLNQQRLPRALSLKIKVEKGERLNDLDIAFLEQVFSDFENIRKIVEDHAKYKAIVTRVIALYHCITSRALANERAV